MAFSFPQQQQQQSLFQFPAPQQQSFQFPSATPSSFQPQQPLFQFQPQQQQPSLFQAPQLQQQTQQIFLYTVDKAPASYSTKWADLHPDSQKYLLMIEERILHYRAGSESLDLCSRLYDSSEANYGFEMDAKRILQELGGTTIAVDRERALIQEGATAIKTMMREAEIAVRSFIMIRQRFHHRNIGTNLATSQSSGQIANPAANTQSLASSPAFDFYSGLPRKPSPFMENTVAGFEKYLTECCKWIKEIEQMLNVVDGKVSINMSSLESLPSVMVNIHDYFIHVAAKVENLHQRVESMKVAYLTDQRKNGDWNDPFLEADRREMAKQEAAARRVHPILHLPAPPAQPTTQSAGLGASSNVASFAIIPQSTSGTSWASSVTGFSNISNSSAPAQTSLFSTPFSSSSQPSLFGTSGLMVQSTPFASASAPIMGSSQPSLFGSTTTPFSSPGFGSSPAFSTPSFATGAATGSGFSFSGAASKSSKPKSRSSRR